MSMAQFTNKIILVSRISYCAVLSTGKMGACTSTSAVPVISTSDARGTETAATTEMKRPNLKLSRDGLPTSETQKEESLTTEKENVDQFGVSAEAIRKILDIDDLQATSKTLNNYDKVRKRCSFCTRVLYNCTDNNENISKLHTLVFDQVNLVTNRI